MKSDSTSEVVDLFELENFDTDFAFIQLDLKN